MNGHYLNQNLKYLITKKGALYLKDFKNQKSHELTKAQKKELDLRIKSFHDNPSIGKSWEDIKNDLKR